MKEKGKSTIYGVAARAGVSIATVSRFLNTPEKVNVDTAHRIKVSMEELDYFPHGHTGAQAYRSIKRIGILSPYFTMPSFVQRLNGMSGVFQNAQAEMVVCAVDSPEQLAEYVRSSSFLSRFDGLIIMSMDIGDADADHLLRSNPHVVMIESVNPRFTCVAADNVLGGRLAAQFFLDKNYLPCGFIGEESSPPHLLQPNRMRLQGYSEALKAAGHPLEPDLVRSGPVNVEVACRQAGELMDLPTPPRAIFAWSDLQAIGALKAARQRDIRIPETLAVLGFDDIEAASFTGLSTVSQSLEESGRVAAQLLLDRIHQPDRALQRVHLDVRIIERETT